MLSSCCLYVKEKTHNHCFSQLHSPTLCVRIVVYKFLYWRKMISWNTECSPSQMASTISHDVNEICTQSFAVQVSASFDLSSLCKDTGPFARATRDPLVPAGICTSCSLSRTIIFSIYCLSSSDLEDLNPLDWVSMVLLFLFFSNPLFFHEVFQGNKPIIRNICNLHLHALRSLDFSFLHFRGFFPLLQDWKHTIHLYCSYQQSLTKMQNCHKGRFRNPI